MNAMTLNMTTAHSNSAAALEPHLKKLAQLGSMEAAGGASRITACELLVELGYQGLMKPTDAASAYNHYKSNVAKMAAKNTAIVDGGNPKQQVSKFATCIKLGELPTIDGPEVAKVTREVTAELRSAEVKTLSPVDALLTVARKQLSNPTVQLTREEIGALVRKPEPRTKDELEKLVDAYKAVVKANDIFKSQNTADAVESLAREITEAGGELPAITKAEKDKAAFLKKAAAMGFTIAQ